MTLRVQINGTIREFPRALTVRGLVHELGVEGKRIAIERNGEIVPRSQYEVVQLADGDKLEVVVAVGGG